MMGLPLVGGCGAGGSRELGCGAGGSRELGCGAGDSRELGCGWEPLPAAPHGNDAGGAGGPGDAEGQRQELLDDGHGGGQMLVGAMVVRLPAPARAGGSKS